MHWYCSARLPGIQFLGLPFKLPKKPDIPELTRAACRIVADVCAEAKMLSRILPLVASPLKGPLFSFLDLDVEMSANTPAAAALQHLALSIAQPSWMDPEARNSSAHAPLMLLASDQIPSL